MQKRTRNSQAHSQVTGQSRTSRATRLSSCAASSIGLSQMRNIWTVGVGTLLLCKVVWLAVTGRGEISPMLSQGDAVITVQSTPARAQLVHSKPSDAFHCGSADIGKSVCEHHCHKPNQSDQSSYLFRTGTSAILYCRVQVNARRRTSKEPEYLTDLMLVADRRKQRLCYST